MGGGPGRDGLLDSRGVEPATFRDGRRSAAPYIGRARDGSPREKFTAIADMIDALER
jgi:hypothetical protein